MTRLADEQRPLAVITGACGGMGRACARLLARRYRLLLTDVSADRLQAFAQELAADGALVDDLIPGDIAAAATVAAIAERIRARGGFRALIHTAGLSPALAGWEAIVEVNLAGTVRLLDAVEPLLGPGSAAVLIASMAGQNVTPSREAEAVLDTPLEPDLARRLEPHVRAMASGDGDQALGMAGYALSKHAVIQLCEKRAQAWGRRGARIVSISPGLIATPMGRKEAQENAAAAALLEATPAGRWGTAADIASAAEFLASDLAGYISGCDLRVDGGAVAALRHGVNG